MTENGWQAIGRIAKARRERLGLKQDQLALYGGPGVSTVGKFERGAQDNFPLRTQHQMENALGWSRTIVEQVVNSINEGELTEEEWEYDLINEDVPDLSRTVVPPAEDGTTADEIEAFATVFRLLDPEVRNEALRAALLAIFPFLSETGAVHLGRGLRDAHTPEGGGSDDQGLDSTSDTPGAEPAENPATVHEMAEAARRTVSGRRSAGQRKRDELAKIGEESQDE